MITWQKVVGIFLVIMIFSTIFFKNERSASKSSSQATEKTFVIGMMQMVAHPALDAAASGFKKAVEDSGIKVKFIQQNAQGNMSNNRIIATNFVADNVDLIFANSTPSAQSALSVTKAIPIVFTSVSDPISAKLVTSLNATNGNITGVTDYNPEGIKKMLAFINKYFSGKRLGVIYNSGEQNSIAQINQLRTIAKDEGFQLIPVTVSNSSEVKQAAQSLIGRVDEIYLVTDNTVASALKSVVSVSQEQRIPLFLGWVDGLKEGGIAATGTEFYDLGYQTGLIAVKILHGEKIANIPVQYPHKLKLYINKQSVNKTGIPFNKEWGSLTSVQAE